MPANKKEPNIVHCAFCGTSKKLSDNTAEVGPCGKCGKTIVDALALLGALGIWTGDQATCPTCQTKNALWHAHCFACGKKLGKG